MNYMKQIFEWGMFINAEGKYSSSISNSLLMRRERIVIKSLWMLNLCYKVCLGKKSNKHKEAHFVKCRKVIQNKSWEHLWVETMTGPDLDILWLRGPRVNPSSIFLRTFVCLSYFQLSVYWFLLEAIDV